MVTTSVTLLERFRDPQDAEAWARFVDLYTPLILNWVRQSGVNSANASDVMQEVFVTLARKLPTFEYDSRRSFGGWLRTVTISKCRNFQRRHRRHEELRPQDWPSMEDDAVRFEVAEYRSYLARRALLLMQSEFETTTWQACWETVVEGRRPKDVALSLGITPNAVYLAKGRVLRRLREHLHGLWE